ncbi:MAG: RNA polymerase sigma factor [Saprospiraceae bacterium]
MLTDKQLLQLFKTDKDAGFRVLMNQYQEQVYWHIRRMVIYHEDADDIVQNTFIKVYRFIDKFENNSKIYTWIYRIATNESLTFLKSKKRRSTVTIDDEQNSLINELKADSYFDGDEVQLLLQKALKILPSKQKAVFNLRYYEEMSYKDMSEVLTTSIGALKASYHHAVKKIEKYIKNER